MVEGERRAAKDREKEKGSEKEEYAANGWYPIVGAKWQSEKAKDLHVLSWSQALQSDLLHKAPALINFCLTPPFPALFHQLISALEVVVVS